MTNKHTHAHTHKTMACNVRLLFFMPGRILLRCAYIIRSISTTGWGTAKQQAYHRTLRASSRPFPLAEVGRFGCLSLHQHAARHVSRLSCVSSLIHTISTVGTNKVKLAGEVPDVLERIQIAEADGDNEDD